MANPRRNKGDIQGQYGLSDLLGLFRDYAKGDIPDSPRQRQAVRNIARDVNLPTALPVASTSLLEAQPQQLATGIMGMSPVEDIVTGETQDMQSMIQPLLTQPETINNLLTKKEEEEIAKDPVALRKYSKAGDMFARLGGFQETPQELLAQATPEELNIYNKQKLQARNQGIGEMLLMLSDAFGGRDIAMRALERQEARQPAKEDLTAAQQNLRAYQEIEKTGTPEEIAIAKAALIGIRQGKSREQLKNEVVANLVKQINPNTFEPYSKEDIEQQIKILDSFYGKTEEIETEQDKPLSFEIPGYTITEG